MKLTTKRLLTQPITMLVIACFVTTITYAQVTIGAGIAPKPGALLDLKETQPLGDNTTATKGFLLPRVKLTVPDKLYPMLEAGYDLMQDELHTGLQVYNVSDISPLCPGVYAWSGEEWQRLGTPCKYTYQCGSGSYPTMSQWAELAGFPGVPETQQHAPQWEIDNLKRDTPNPVTGIAWHRDQSGNIFLSASFHATDITGNTERWMITNLAATSYASGVTNIVDTLTQSANNSDPLPYWAYSNTYKSYVLNSDTIYNNNPRLGLLYNWSAATAGKGGTNGQENPANETGHNSYTRVQGICPTGWHLPSDWEWTALEQAIINNKSTFSSSATSTGDTLTDELTNATYGVSQPAVGTVGTSGWRGLANNTNGHGAAMKEGCEPHNNDVRFQGQSNTIGTTARPGFEILLAGVAANGYTSSYSAFGFFWSTSSYNDRSAWTRTVRSDLSQVSRGTSYRNYLHSVRCKKD